jgi:hypothetical protein
MKVRITTQVTINAEPAEVFEYIKNLKYHFLWNPQLRTIDPVIRLKAGAEYKTTSLVLGKRLTAVNKVIGYTENRELELENTTGLVHYSAKFTLMPKSKKTRLICSTRVDSASKAFAFAKPVLEILARRELQSDLRALKLAVEHRLDPDS